MLEKEFEELKNRDLWRRYSEYLQVERGLSSNTLRGYQCDIKKLDIFARKLGKEIISLCESDILAFIRELTKGGLSSRSIVRTLSAVRGLYSFLKLDGIVGKSPCERITTPSFQKSLPQYLLPDEIVNLFQAFDSNTPIGLRDRALIELLYATGIRVSELTMIKLKDLNLDRGLLSCFGKGSKQRSIPVGRSAINAIGKYLEQRHALTTDNDTKILFLRPDGKPMTRQNVWSLLKRYAERTGIQRLTPHMLRHSFATHMMQGGADTRVLQVLLGHSDLITTQVYTHLTATNLISTHQLHHPRAKKEPVNSVSSIKTDCV
jgi:integrase/recombinase XerD